MLDAPREGDIPAVLEACQDAETRRWVPLPEPYTQSDAEFFVRSYYSHGLVSGQYAVWALRTDATKPLVGVVEVRRDEAAGSASLGCWLTPSARGRGLMGEALAVVCAYALDPVGLGYDRLRWECLAGNDESRRLAEAVGFRFDGRSTATFLGAEQESLIGELHRDGVEG